MMEPQDRQLSGLLRRLDWRLLLPIDPPERVHCEAGPELTAAVEHLYGAPRPAGSAAQLAVVSPSSPAALGAAHAALEPGGALYCEWPSPGTSVRRARRALAAAGFGDVQIIWPWPSPSGDSQPRFWLPLGNRTVERHFQRTRTVPPGRAGRLRRALAIFAWRCGRSTGRLGPLCAIARRPGGGRRRGLAQQIAAASSPPLRALPPLFLQTGGHSSFNKVVATVFADDAREPQMIVKVPRIEHAAGMLEREAAMLRALAARRGGVPHGAPRLLLEARWSGGTIIGQSVLSGQTVAERLQHAPTAEPIATAATAFLIELAGTPGTAPRAQWWASHVAPALDVLAARRPHERALLDAAGAYLGELDALPAVLEHRDFTPWNTLIQPDGSFAALDWESGREHGIAGLDLTMFLTHLALFDAGTMQHADEQQTYAELLDDEHPRGALRVRCERRYCEAAGLDPGAMGPLRTLTWITHAHEDLVDGPGLRADAFLRFAALELERARPVAR